MRTRKESKNLLLILVLPFLLLLAIGLPLITINTNQVFEEYPEFHSDEGINIRIVSYDRFKGTTLVTDAGGNKRSLKAYSKDGEYPLFDFLENNDSLARKIGSHSLFLYKQNDSVIEFELIYIE